MVASPEKLSFNLIFSDISVYRPAHLAYSEGTGIFLGGRQSDRDFNVNVYII